jgi:hypothetical protein
MLRPAPFCDPETAKAKGVPYLHGFTEDLKIDFSPDSVEPEPTSYFPFWLTEKGP